MRFEFHHSWLAPGSPAEVYEVLRDVERYPEWWPQILAVAYVDERTGRVLARSLAPFVLDLLLTSEVEDPEAGRLRVGLAGDLEGECGFALDARHGGTAVDFDQSVEVTRRGLDRAARLLGPALRVNHAWMMRGCRRGLAGRLAQDERRGSSRPK